MQLVEPAPAEAGLRVIGAGFGRTGTLSIKAALEELGFDPCYHMTVAFAQPVHAVRWAAASRGEAVDWRELLAGYRATVDWPACSYYRELVAAFPDAKVLLTVREAEGWYDSVRATIYRMRKLTTFPPVRQFLRVFLPNTQKVLVNVHETFWDNTFKGRFTDRQYAIGVYNAHIEAVKSYVPPERLVVFSARDGWEPLCTFLGVPVPAGKPFPSGHGRVNYFVLALRIAARGR
ncbi:MAG: hypothetical protein QOD36_1486 [Mycobacterium sp.]|nr:hypothetical protein [Mycobacterium sp.]